MGTKLCGCDDNKVTPLQESDVLNKFYNLNLITIYFNFIHSSANQFINQIPMLTRI